MKVQRTKKGNLIVGSKYDFNCAVIGMLLGDGCLNRFDFSRGPENKSKKGPLWHRTELRIQHKISHKEYLDWKINLIRSYVDDVSIYEKSKIIGDKIFYGYEAFIKHRKNFHYLYKHFYVGGHLSINNRVTGATKVLKKSILNRLSPLSIAIWYMDDGSLYTFSYDGKIRRQLSLNTDGFTFKECEMIKQFFIDKYDIYFNINKNGITKTMDGGFKLRTAKQHDIEKFFDIVSVFVKEVKCMNYKLPL